MDHVKGNSGALLPRQWEWTPEKANHGEEGFLPRSDAVYRVPSRANIVILCIGCLNDMNMNMGMDSSHLVSAMRCDTEDLKFDVFKTA
ncbi:hypothetical protein N7494_001509 [Penicillium frequentans]|uniref:Uncharacterized protein n=1 Tax=Penicillium frequentans TaxID=3151616 RepID=A0AAD6GJB1_9EURO|nr:hypothetical protein N7494_001509 [Penicillium glabrum]